MGRYVDSDSNNVSLCCWPTTVNCNALSLTFGVRVKIRLPCTPSIFRAGQRRQIKRLVDRVREIFERWVRFELHTLSFLRKYLWWVFIPVDYEIVQQFYRIKQEPCCISREAFTFLRFTFFVLGFLILFFSPVYASGTFFYLLVPRTGPRPTKMGKVKGVLAPSILKFTKHL